MFLEMWKHSWLQQAKPQKRELAAAAEQAKKDAKAAALANAAINKEGQI